MHSEMAISLLASAFIAGTGFSALAHDSVPPTSTPSASEADARGGPPEGHRPPPFAYEACAKLEKGAVCTVHLRDRELQGHCMPDSDEALFCMPDEMPPPPPGGGGPGPTL